MHATETNTSACCFKQDVCKATLFLKMWITTISTAGLFTNCKTGAYQSTQRRLGTEHPTTNLLKWAIQAGRAAKAPRELLRLQNSQRSTETHFPISPKTGRGRGGPVFYYDRPDNSRPPCLCVSHLFNHSQGEEKSLQSRRKLRQNYETMFHVQRVILFGLKEIQQVWFVFVFLQFICCPRTVNMLASVDDSSTFLGQ